MGEVMSFPETWEEFEKVYGFTDKKEVYYTNGTRLIPSFRVEQWLEHLESERKRQEQLYFWWHRKEQEKMSVLLIEANKDGKYEFTKEELQTILDKVEQEAFERGVAFEKARKPEKEYVYLNNPSPNPLNPYVNWNKVTCEATEGSLFDAECKPFS